MERILLQIQRPTKTVWIEAIVPTTMTDDQVKAWIAGHLPVVTAVAAGRNRPTLIIQPR